MAGHKTSLNVIGLISGGKDSFFSILHCLTNGHRVIALGNLHPLDQHQKTSPENIQKLDAVSRPIASKPGEQTASSEDLNSFMYQTAGHMLIPLYEDALSIPLYRQGIVGSAKNSSKHYQNHQTGARMEETQYDETESLVPLLRKIMAAHPEANAVCSGAILSTYQRTRIESVTIRLGLIPLSYLWQYPILPPPSPGGLLDDVAAIGFDVRIVKVASGGLDDSLLWSNLIEPVVRQKVERAVGRFGGNVLGEGGEYETLIIDGPAGLWKGRIEVNEAQMRTCIESGSDAQAWLEFEQGVARIVPKASSQENWKENLRNIGLWDSHFERLKDSFYEMARYGSSDKQGQGALESIKAEKKMSEEGSSNQDTWSVRPYEVTVGQKTHLFNMSAAEAGCNISNQITQISRDLTTTLTRIHRSPNDILFTTILLRSMSDFAAVNSIYSQVFTEPNPPARVTVACGEILPVGVNVMLSCVLNLGVPAMRDGLHVQSRSYWAPANIGPYSQAISLRLIPASEASLVYVAGQIPLVPATMKVLQAEDDQRDEALDESQLFAKQTCLALQHLWRIGSETSVNWWTGGIAFITCREDSIRIKAKIAWEAWKRVHSPSLWQTDQDDDDDGLDAWDRKYGTSSILSTAIPEKQHHLPNFSKIITDNTDSPIPPFFAIEVSALPQNCSIEWQSLGIAHDSINLNHTPIHNMKATSVTAAEAGLRFTYINIPPLQDLAMQLSRIAIWARENFNELRAGGGESDATEGFHVTVYTARTAMVRDIEAMVVPCTAVWGAEGEELAAGVVVECGGAV